MKFKLKSNSLEVDAFQYDGDFMNSEGEYYVPQWAVRAFKWGKLFFGTYCGVPAELFVKGYNHSHVDVDEYVIIADDDEIYHCNPKLFRKLFEKASESENGD